MSDVSNLQSSELYSAEGHLNCCMDKIKNFFMHVWVSEGQFAHKT